MLVLGWGLGALPDTFSVYVGAPAVWVVGLVIWWVFTTPEPDNTEWLRTLRWFTRAGALVNCILVMPLNWTEIERTLSIWVLAGLNLAMVIEGILCWLYTATLARRFRSRIIANGLVVLAILYALTHVSEVASLLEGQPQTLTSSPVRTVQQWEEFRQYMHNPGLLLLSLCLFSLAILVNARLFSRASVAMRWLAQRAPSQEEA